MRFLFALLIITTFSSSVVDAQGIVMESSEPEVPDVVIVKEVVDGQLVYKAGNGDIVEPIVDPDVWTPFPTPPPVVTGSPTAYPTPLSPAPTKNPYYLWHNGSHDQCIFDTGLLKDDCLHAAELVGKDFNFPYYLNIIDDPTAPCGCFFQFNGNGEPIVDWNRNTPEVGGCSANNNARLICEIPPPTMAPSPGEDCFNLDETYYASEGSSYCYKVETGAGTTNHFRQRRFSSDCASRFADNSEEWYVGSNSGTGTQFYANGATCNGNPREGQLNIIEEDRVDTVTTATSRNENGVCFYEVTVRRPPCLGTYAPVPPTLEPTITQDPYALQLVDNVSMKYVEASGDGSIVFGIDPSNNVYYRYGANGSWTTLSDSNMMDISVSQTGAHIWGISPNQNIYYRNGINGSWSQVSGSLVQITVNADNTLIWGVNINQHIYYRTGVAGSWNSINGGLSQVSVSGDGSDLWGVNSARHIYHRPNGGDWSYIGGLAAKWISTNYDGERIWAITADDTVYYRLGTSGSWVLFSGSLKSISVSGPNGEYVWGVDAGNNVYHLETPPYISATTPQPTLVPTLAPTTLAPTPEPTGGASEGTIEVNTGVGLGKCLGYDNYGDLFLYDCTGGIEQIFALETDGTFLAKGGSKADQCLLADGWFWPKMRPCTGAAQQQWSFRNGKITTNDGSKCLRFDPAWSSNRLKVEDCDNNAHDQIWTRNSNPRWFEVYSTEAGHTPNQSYWASGSAYIPQNGGFMIKRMCSSCSGSHDKVIYKRLTPIPNGFDVPNLFLNTWSSANNVLNTDFELYSSWNAATSGSDKWTFCNYDDNGIGFPRDCGKDGQKGGQWNSLHRGGQSSYSFYVWSGTY